MPRKQVRINIRSLANSAAIREEQRHGRKHIIVPSATLPDDVVMNDIMYPAAEIEKSFTSLNDTPAPLGHPMVNGQFISAKHPVGYNLASVGAWNENVRRENGRVFLDKVIDVQVAERTSEGKAVLNAIEAGDPIHTSTGLLCYLENAAEGSEHKYIAREIEFDHDAILLNEEGAATPEQGVGMMVNSKGEKIEVIHSALEDAERDLDWAADMAARAVERMERAPLLERIKSAIMEAVTGSERETTANTGDAGMADDKQLEALSADVDAIKDSLSNLGETISNAVTEAVKPLKDAHDEMVANQKAEEEAKRTKAVNTLVKSGQWTEEDLEEMPLAALNKLVDKTKPGKAAAINGAGGGDGKDDEFADVDLNAGMEDK